MIVIINMCLSAMMCLISSYVMYGCLMYNAASSCKHGAYTILDELPVVTESITQRKSYRRV